MREAVIVAMSRTAVGRAKKGTTRTTRPEALVSAVLHDLLRQAGGRLDPNEIDDFMLGCAMPEGAQGLNFARIAGLQAGLPVSVPAQTVNRFCSSGLQTIATAAERIIANGADIIIAGGVESMSQVPMAGFHFSPSLEASYEHPEIYLGMGLTAERVAEQYGISREDQDEFAYQSHMKAAAATDAGKFAEEIVPVIFEEVALVDGQRQVRAITFDQDEHLRRDTTRESLARLKPAFKQNGTVTAGNASGINDSGAATVVMSADKAKELGLKPMATIKSFATAGVEPAYMGTGPIPASKKAMAKAGLTVADFDVIEANEAFAAQALTCIRGLELPMDKVNLNGGAIAIGHPIGASGSRILTTLLYELKKQNGRYGLATMCIGGGQGVAMIVENIQ